MLKTTLGVSLVELFVQKILKQPERVLYAGFCECCLLDKNVSTLAKTRRNQRNVVSFLNVELVLLEFSFILFCFVLFFFDIPGIL